MISKLFVFILALLLIASVYTVSCEQEKAAKLEMLSATREQVGDAERDLMDCNMAVQAIEDEIAKLRDIIIQKKVTELRACKDRFDQKTKEYEALYKSAHGRGIFDEEYYEAAYRAAHGRGIFEI